ncbi:MAG: hypothetical protein Q7J98_01530 [Kiritimatiellia bacterium]|nr:hypothetical protein [Kiritimatiellia bacterium]
MKSNSDMELMRRWIQCWQQAGVELESIRREDIRLANTRQAIENLDDAFESALRHQIPSIHSGLEQQQALFHKSRS